MKKTTFYKRLVQRVMAFTALLLVVSIGIAIKTTTTNNNASAEWGEVALTPAEDALQRISPISFANACGLGASSCFRCHNGRRAEAPGDDPWHQEHTKVNFSCAGCHQGNPRIIKQSIAHKKMIANPLQTPDESCSSCHKGDVHNKLEPYAKLQTVANPDTTSVNDAAQSATDPQDQPQEGNEK